MMSTFGKIRVIGGKWKGYKIPVVCSNKTVRPTKNFLRETLFNWLYPVVAGSWCLDCFAGSGALGIESLSRGASKVTFLDHSLDCIFMLSKVIQFLRVSDICEIICVDCFLWLKKSRGIFYDIVFIDPPFAETRISEIFFLLEKYNYLQTKAWVYVETSSTSRNFCEDHLLPDYWILYRKKVTCTVKCYLYYRHVL